MAEYRYSKDHEWALRQDDRVKVGISDFAQGELGEIAYVELPEVGKMVARGDPVCSIDSLKSSSEIYAPVSGTVVSVNEELNDEEKCELVNRDPLGEGWVFALQMGDATEFDSLLTQAEYDAYVQDNA